LFFFSLHEDRDHAEERIQIARPCFAQIVAAERPRRRAVQLDLVLDDVDHVEDERELDEEVGEDEQRVREEFVAHAPVLGQTRKGEREDRSDRVHRFGELQRRWLVAADVVQRPLFWVFCFVRFEIEF